MSPIAFELDGRTSPLERVAAKRGAAQWEGGPSADWLPRLSRVRRPAHVTGQIPPRSQLRLIAKAK